MGLTLSRDFKQIQTIPTVRLRGFLCLSATPTLIQFVWWYRWSRKQPNATLFTICASLFGTVQALEHFASVLHQWALNKEVRFVFCVCLQLQVKARSVQTKTMCLRGYDYVWSREKEPLMEGKLISESTWMWVQMTLAGCGRHEEVCTCVWVCKWVCGGGRCQNSRRLCLCSSGPRGARLRLSHNLQCSAHV